MLELSTVSLFLRALGAFAAFAPPERGDKIVQYTNKAARMIDLADAGKVAVDQARHKLEADAQLMQRWVETGYEPTDADLDSLETRIDDLHDRYQAAKTPS